MKCLLLNIVISLFSFSCLFAQIEQKRIKINSENSFVKVHGSTNVNEFRCTYSAELPIEELEITYQQKGENFIIKHEALFLKVINFTCPNSQMTEDFHDLLDYEQYPYIIFQVQKIINHNTAEIIIEMAGEQKTYLVDIQNNFQDNLLACTTTMQICITDFGLKAPEKFFGMVKVNENIEVEFKIEMNIIDN